MAQQQAPPAAQAPIVVVVDEVQITSDAMLVLVPGAQHVKDHTPCRSWTTVYDNAGAVTSYTLGQSDAKGAFLPGARESGHHLGGGGARGAPPRGRGEPRPKSRAPTSQWASRPAPRGRVHRRSGRPGRRFTARRPPVAAAGPGSTPSPPGPAASLPQPSGPQPAIHRESDTLTFDRARALLRGGADSSAGEPSALERARVLCSWGESDPTAAAVGSTVAIHSLVSRPSMNGKVGVVVSASASTARFGVRVAGEAKALALRRAVQWSLPDSPNPLF